MPELVIGIRSPGWSLRSWPAGKSALRPAGHKEHEVLVTVWDWGAELAQFGNSAQARCVSARNGCRYTG